MTNLVLHKKQNKIHNIKPPWYLTLQSMELLKDVYLKLRWWFFTMIDLTRHTETTAYAKYSTRKKYCPLIDADLGGYFLLNCLFREVLRKMMKVGLFWIGYTRYLQIFGKASPTNAGPAEAGRLGRLQPPHILAKCTISLYFLAKFNSFQPSASTL